MQRRRNLEKLEKHFINNYNALGTRKNHKTHRKRYREFCKYSNTTPFPVNEFKLSKFATFLSDLMKTVESIKAYCATICDDHKMKGYKPVHRGLKFHRMLAGIRKQLRHRVKRAQPMTTQLLTEIEKVVNKKKQKEEVVWCAMLGGFNMVLRKSNLVPLKRVHDRMHNITRSDVRYSNGVMVVVIRWSKTNQNSEQPKTATMIVDKSSSICAVRWILYMMKIIPAGPVHNLFSFVNKHGQIAPITYRDLMVQMREWIKKSWGKCS